jgi:electron transfer flavoprotein-quinone oxidoreductase
MSNEKDLDLIVVGAGPAGLACAWEAATKGLQVAVLERGDVAGAKNLSGGRLYLAPLQDICGDLLKNAPLERRVVVESIVLTDDASSISFKLDARENREESESATVLRAKLDQFMADKASEAGALVMGQQSADRLLRENGKVVGVMVGTEELRANAIVAADGALSLIAEEAGLRPKRSTSVFGVGVKEIIKLDKALINERFNVSDGEGEARLFIGQITRGLPGGGFLYTNADSLSIGFVVHMKALQEWKSEKKLWELMERFKERPDIAPLIAGGQTVEYGAHLIPEGGMSALPSLGVPGLMLCGDAAGLVLNTGATVRGMDLAIASGVLAGHSIAEAKESGYDSATCLKRYEQALKKSFVVEQMRAHKKASGLLELRRLYDYYPKELVQLAWEFFSVSANGESMSIGKAIKKMRRQVLGWRGIKDIWRLSRM